MIDKITFKQLYLRSRIRTQAAFEKNVERWKRREDEQLKELLLQHMKEAGIGDPDLLAKESGNDVLV